MKGMEAKQEIKGKGKLKGREKGWKPGERWRVLGRGNRGEKRGKRVARKSGKRWRVYEWQIKGKRKEVKGWQGSHARDEGFVKVKWKGREGLSLWIRSWGWRSNEGKRSE